MLMRFDPFRELDRLTSELDNGGRAWPQVLPMDAYRSGDHFTVHFDLPGADPGTIDLTVEKNVLSIRAERRWQRADTDEVLVNERPQGSFTRQLFLGEALDPDRIQASYENGVLTVTIPVAEKAKPRKVEIATSNGGPQAVDASSTEVTSSAA